MNEIQADTLIELVQCIIGMMLFLFSVIGAGWFRK